MAAVTTLSAGGRIATQPAKDHDSVAVSDVGLLRMEDCACHGSLLFHVDITIHVAHVAGNVCSRLLRRGALVAHYPIGPFAALFPKNVGVSSLICGVVRIDHGTIFVRSRHDASSFSGITSD